MKIRNNKKKLERLMEKVSVITDKKLKNIQKFLLQQNKYKVINYFPL